MYEHSAVHDHVAGWAPVRSGHHNAEVHLSFKDTSAQHRQQLASAGTIQLTMHGAAAPVTLPVSTVSTKQLPDVIVVRMHNVPGGINVHGLMDCLLKHLQFGPEYSVVSEYGGDASGDMCLQSSEPLCQILSWPDCHQPSLALGSRSQCQSSPAS